jgi:hypothetical protein
MQQLTPADLIMYKGSDGVLSALGFPLNLPFSIGGGGTGTGSSGKRKKNLDNKQTDDNKHSDDNKHAEAILNDYQNFAIPAGLFVKTPAVSGSVGSNNDDTDEVDVISNDLYEQLLRLSEINKVVLKLTKRNPSPLKKGKGSGAAKTKKQKMTRRRS